MENNDDILKNFPKGDPFKAPEGYFENLAAEISDRSSHSFSASRKFINWKHPLKLAASFAILVVMIYAAIISIKYTTDNPTKTIAEVSDTLSEEYAFVDENAIIHFMSDTTIAQAEPNADSMIEFLVDENVSYDLLADYY